MTDISRDHATEQCRQLIRINTSNPPGNEKEAASFCKAILEEIGFDTQLISHGNNRASLVAVLEGRPDADTILFVGHLDTVPPGDLSFWEVDPYSASSDEKKIIGRGASDMKGGLTALLQAAGTLKGKKPANTIVLALTADEESGCLGSNALLDIPMIRKSKMVLIPEPTANDIGIAEKGALWVKVSTKGKSAHGSMPDLGLNAIDELVALINSLDFSAYQNESHEYLGAFTHSLNTISGGIKTNIIPDSCEITMDLRTLPAQNHREILDRIDGCMRDLMNSNPDYAYRLEKIVDKPGIESDYEQDYPAQIIDLIKSQNSASQMIGLNYYTDGAILIPALGVPFLIFGPGDPEQAHKPNEELDIEKLMHSCEMYAMIMQYLADT